MIFQRIEGIHYNPDSTTNSTIPTIKKIVEPVPFGIGLIRGISRQKKERRKEPIHNTFWLVFFFIVANAEIVEILGL